MTTYFSRLSPVPGFPSYTGPYKVGTLDVELPISQLESPAPAPCDDIPTVQYRIFYPCEPDAKGKNISWLPSPQRGYVSAYTRFLGAGNYLAEFISFFPRLLHYISIPAVKNAPLLTPTTADKRWPVMIFSHGLGGSRNAYSHLVGSIASHGVIVIAPEHRDGSTPISYIRAVPSEDGRGEKTRPKNGKRTTSYTRYSHTPSPEVEEGRNAQLKIRLWELGLIHDSLSKVDEAADLKNLNTSSVSLSMFKARMNVHTPGAITFAGHSFGATTTVQLIKSTFYAPQTSEAPKEYTPLFTPSSRSAISQQITPQTPVILLDCWCMPLSAATTRWLFNKPLPCYSLPSLTQSPLLAVESQAFYKWRAHLKSTKRLLSPNPSSDEYNYDGGKIAEPNFYYATSSAHLSQSDFGMLFPWLVRRVFAAEEPDRVMRLNVRAILQVMRNSGISVAPTSPDDMEIPGKEEGREDTLILGRKGEVRGWNYLNTNVAELGDVDEDSAMKGSKEVSAKAEPSEAVVGNELMKQKGTAEKL